MKKILVLVTLLLMISCKQSFQMRIIYFSEIDNLCYPFYGQRVPTTFVFHQQENITQNLWLGIDCSRPAISFFQGISSSGQFTTEIQQQQIDFGVEMKKRVYLTEKHITTNITMKTKQISYKGFIFSCFLRGDGQVQHYNVIDSPITSTLTIECEKKYAQKIEMI